MKALETATLIGISPTDFWELTPFEFGLMVKAFSMNKENDYHEKITLAYMTAAWAAQWFGKQKPPTLEKILSKKPKESMTDKQMLSQVKLLNAVFGGEVKENGN